MQGTSDGPASRGMNLIFTQQPQQVITQPYIPLQQNVYSQTSGSQLNNQSLYTYNAQSQPTMFQHPYTQIPNPTSYLGYSQQPQMQTFMHPIQTPQPSQIYTNPLPHINYNTQQKTQWETTSITSDIPEVHENKNWQDDKDMQSVISDESEVIRPNDFQEVKPRKKRKRLNNSPLKDNTPANQNVRTQNRFQPFMNTNNDEENNSGEQHKKEIVPPFILHFVEKITPLINLINSTVKSNEYYYEILKGNKVKLQTNNIENYKKIKKTLDDNKVIRHTYTLEENKKYRVVLRNLHHTTEHEEIKTALQTLGHTVENISGGFIKNKQDIPKNLFFIDLKKKDNNAEIFKTKLLLNAVVKFEEPRKKSNLIQCLRCCCYGHTKSNCTRPMRCYKCAEKHDYKTCNKKKDDGKDPKCILCGGNHPATAKICKVYKEIVSRRFPSRKLATPTNPETETAKLQQNSSQEQEKPNMPKPKNQYSIQRVVDLPQQAQQSTTKPNRYSTQSTINLPQQEQQPIMAKPQNQYTTQHTPNLQKPTYAQITNDSNIITFLQATITNQQQTMNQMAAEIKSLREQLTQLTNLITKNGTAV